MEACRICKGEQDTRYFKGYNICTECADLMEDLMSEYFQRTIKIEVSNSKKWYINYVESVQQFASDYQRIRKHSKQHINLNSFDLPPYSLKSTSMVSLNIPLNPIISNVLSDIPVKFRCQFFT